MYLFPGEALFQNNRTVQIINNIYDKYQIWYDLIINEKPAVQRSQAGTAMGRADL